MRRYRSATPDRRLGTWLAVTGAVYAVGAATVFARPRDVPASLSRIGGEAIEPEEPPGVLHSLATAYMATIAALALAAARDPVGRDWLIPPLLVAKATSSAAMLYRYQATRRVGFAAGAALDAALFGVTAGLYAATRG